MGLAVLASHPGQALRWEERQSQAVLPCRSLLSRALAPAQAPEQLKPGRFTHQPDLHAATRNGG